MIPEEIKAIDMKMNTLKGTDYDKIIVSGGDNEAEKQLVNLISEKAELQRNYEITKSVVTVTLEALAQLTEEERTVVTRMFIAGTQGAIDTLCEELHCERTKVYDIRKRAIIRLAHIMYGVAEL